VRLGPWLYRKIAMTESVQKKSTALQPCAGQGLSSVRVYRCAQPIQVLSKWLEKAVTSGQRVWVVTQTQDQAKNLDDKLWTYSQRTFLPHGLQGQDQDPKDHPIWIDWAIEDNANQAKTLALLQGLDNADQSFVRQEQLLELGICNLVSFVTLETLGQAGGTAVQVKTAIAKAYSPLPQDIRVFDQTPTGWVET
jgi:DNA polymerase IIIc chi subunit